MTPDLATLRDLLARVREAIGPDRFSRLADEPMAVIPPNVPINLDPRPSLLLIAERHAALIAKAEHAQASPATDPAPPGVTVMMKLWLLTTEYFDYDEYDGYVVRAESAERARAICRVDEKQTVSGKPQQWTCEEILQDGPEVEILASFNAG